MFYCIVLRCVAYVGGWDYVNQILDSRRVLRWTHREWKSKGVITVGRLCSPIMHWYTDEHNITTLCIWNAQTKGAHTEGALTKGPPRVHGPDQGCVHRPRGKRERYMREVHATEMNLCTCRQVTSSPVQPSTCHNPPPVHTPSTPRPLPVYSPHLGSFSAELTALTSLSYHCLPACQSDVKSRVNLVTAVSDSSDISGQPLPIPSYPYQHLI